MDVDTKTTAIGILLIGVVAMAGWVGFLYASPIIKTKTEEDEETVYITNYVTVTEEEDPWGLPEDWSNAPNSTYITVNNGTDTFDVTLGDILDGVALYLEQVAAQQAGAGEINAYKNFLELKTIHDPLSDSYFTGVDILDILARFNTYFAVNLSLVSTKTPDGVSRTEYFNTTSHTIIAEDYCYEGDDTYLVVLAMNKGWLLNSPFGNFTFMRYDDDDDKISDCLLNFEEINVESYWEVKISINNTDNPTYDDPDDFTTWFTVDRTNMMDNEFTANHSYDDNADWNYNRQFWGRNITEIANIALTNGGYAGQNYTARFWSADDWGEPYPYGKKKDKVPYNITDIEEGLDPAKKGDMVNDPEELVPASDLLMCLCYAQRELGEGFGSVWDPVWPSKKINNYHKGPFNIVIPGRTRDYYLKYVTELRITVFPGEIPPNYEDF